VPRLLDQLPGCLAGHFDVEHSPSSSKPPPTPATNPART